MARPPKPEDLKKLRRLRTAAGSERELLRWLRAAVAEGNQKRGRKHLKEEFPLHLLEWWCHRVQREQGLDRTGAIRLMVQRMGILQHNEAAAIARLRRKLRGGGLFQKRARQIMKNLRPANLIRTPN
jgi:hypothetical protein